MANFIWNDVRDSILISCPTVRSAQERLGISGSAAKDRLRRLRKMGRTTHFFARENLFWTPERDARLVKFKTGKEASVYFGVSISHVTQRMSDLRKKGQTTKFWREPKTTLPSKNSKARWDIDVEREAARGPYVPVRECEAFLAALSEHEKPPVETTVRTRQPLMRNPSLVTGSCCSSSSGWE